MKTILEKNCHKKIKPTKQRKTMAEMGASVFIDKKPKMSMGMRKAESAKLL